MNLNKYFSYKIFVLFLMFVYFFTFGFYFGDLPLQVLNSMKSKDSSSNTWPKVDLHNCSNIVYLNKGINQNNPIKLPRVGVVSFPGSGNTWLRYLIREATGIWTGSVYTDKSLFTGGFQAEMESCDNNSTVAIKAHSLKRGISGTCPFDKIIYLLRDPFHAILAEFNRQRSHSHVKLPDMSIYNTTDWINFVPRNAKQWKKATEQWMNNFRSPRSEIGFTSNPRRSGNILMVSFKRLKANSQLEMKRIVQYLALPNYRRNCILKSDPGKFQRKGKKPDIGCVYKSTDISIVYQAEKQLLAVVKEFGMTDVETEFDKDIMKDANSC